jgi:hypothetical protein
MVTNPYAKVNDIASAFTTRRFSHLMPDPGVFGLSIKHPLLVQTFFD